MESSISDETSPATRLRGFFLPLASPGHMIPLIDFAILLSRRGVSPTIVITPGNESLARPAIDRANSLPSSPSLPIHLILLPFPPSPASSSLPSINHDNLSKLHPSLHAQFLTAVESLRPSLLRLLRFHRADFLVSDSVLAWSVDMADELGIPRIAFEGYGAFPLCIHESLFLLKPHVHFSKIAAPPIRITDLPDPIEITKQQTPISFDYPEFTQWIKQAEEKSFGVVVNTFYDLEPGYADAFLRRRLGRRAWFVGPLSSSDQNTYSVRGGHAHSESVDLMRWLDSQPTRSVIYACFGTLSMLDATQMRDTAIGLASCGRAFVWVVRNWDGLASQEEWLPEGFEEGVGKRGWVVRGWAPQAALLEHAAVGGFVTHCGWNSLAEGVAAGVPMVTRPMMFDQFMNEKLLVDVLKVGVRMEADLAAAVERVMGGGEEAELIRERATELRRKAAEAVAAGGSSYEDVGRLVDELEAVAVRRIDNVGSSQAPPLSPMSVVAYGSSRSSPSFSWMHLFGSNG